MGITEEDKKIDATKGATAICANAQLLVHALSASKSAKGVGDLKVSLQGGKPEDTGADGLYLFDDVDPGKATLLLETPPGWFHAEIGRVRCEYKLKAPLEAGIKRIVTVPLLPLRAKLFVDAERNGTLTSKELTKWEWGAGKRGAVVCVNSDEPNLLEHDHITDKESLEDIAPLDIHCPFMLPHPEEKAFELFLELGHSKNRYRLRIFSGRTPGAQEIVGPSIGEPINLLDPEYRELWKGRTLELGMEATCFDGQCRGLPVGPIPIVLQRVDRGSKPLVIHVAMVRVAPWIMTHHLMPARRVYAASMDGTKKWNNLAPVSALKGIMGLAEVELNTELGGHNDRWAQDCMEFGFSCRPRVGPVPCVMEAPRGVAGLHKEVLQLRNTGFGHFAFKKGKESDANRLGNLEVTPPCEVDGQVYPFGRIYYGSSKTKKKELLKQAQVMLMSQKVQKPFVLDTNFLDLGHVDEILSFVPCPKGPPKAWKAVMPEPWWALTLLEIANKIHPEASVFGGKRFVDQADIPHKLPGTIEAFWDDSMTLGLITVKGEPLAEEGEKGLFAARQELKKQIGLTNDRIIKLPVAFCVGRSGGTGFLTGNTVNMLVIGNRCIMAKPFGPVMPCRLLKKWVALDSKDENSMESLLRGCRSPDPFPCDLLKQAIEKLSDEGERDIFEVLIEEQLRAEGLEPHFIDTWDAYHSSGGGIHCATNCLRDPGDDVKWWEFVPEKTGKEGAKKTTGRKSQPTKKSGEKKSRTGDKRK